MQHNTPRYSMQPMYHYCKNTGHFKYNCLKLVTATPSKTPPRKPVALTMSQGRDQESNGVRAVFGREGVKAFITPSSIDTRLHIPREV